MFFMQDIQYGGFQPATTTSESAGDSYGSPIAEPVSGYDEVVAPLDSYGSPQADPITNDGYTSPGADPVAPPDNYGSPLADPVSDSGYNSPSAQPPETYGVPLADPADNYDAPEAAPLPPDGVSVDTPVESFIPKDQLEDDPLPSYIPQVAKAKSAKSVSNSKYDPFDFQAARAPTDDESANLQLDNDNINLLGGNNFGRPGSSRPNRPAFNEPLVIGPQAEVFNPFGVSVASGHVTTPGPNPLPSSTTTRRPLGTNSINVTPFAQQNINPSNPPQSGGRPPSSNVQITPLSFFPSGNSPSRRPVTRPTTVRQRTTRTTRRTTTFAPILLQQNNQVVNNGLDDGLRDNFNVLNFGTPTLNPFQRPEKLQITDRPKIKELSGSGIFFSTPSTTFTSTFSPQDFGTPTPTPLPSNLDHQQLNINHGALEEGVRSHGQPFSVQQVVTTTASPLGFLQTTLRGRGEPVTGTPRPSFITLGTPVPGNSLVPQFPSSFNRGVSGVTPTPSPLTFGGSPTPAAQSPALFTANIPPAPSSPAPSFSATTPSSSPVNTFSQLSSGPSRIPTRPGGRPSTFTSFVLGSQAKMKTGFGRHRETIKILQNCAPHCGVKYALRKCSKNSKYLDIIFLVSNSSIVGIRSSKNKKSCFHLSCQALDPSSALSSAPAITRRPRPTPASRSRQTARPRTKDTDAESLRRNMLMNIILRPGGGDRAKALPRPKVEVNSEGSNVIVVKLTFPENENIQGLRAFTPTDPRDLEKFAELRNALSSEDASVERITAISSEEENFIDTSQSKKIEKLKKLEETKKQPSGKLLADPTRPPRPHKAKRPSLSYLPPVGAPLPLSKPSPSAYLPPPPQIGEPKVFNLMDKKKESFFRFRETSDEILDLRSGEVSRIKPRQPQDKPPTDIPKRTPSSFTKSSQEFIPFTPSEAYNEHKHFHLSFPSRPPRPPKSIQIINNLHHPPRPNGPPPLPQRNGPPSPRLPPKGVQLTRNGKRHPGVQSRLDSIPSPSRSYYPVYPVLQKAWRGLQLL